MRFYKKVTILGQDQWLQNLDLTPSPLKIVKTSKDFKEALTKENTIDLFSRELYIDPERQNSAYIINEKGIVDFELRIKPSKEGIVINQMFDLRGSKRTGPLAGQ